MSNISTNINLTALTHTVRKFKNKAGAEVDCLVIPIEANHLFVGEKGSVYLNTNGYSVRESKVSATHIVKQAFKKEFYDSLTDEEKKAFPIIGNHLVYGSNIAVNAVEMENVSGTDEDLPF
jgi:hypothetical protein